jgi:N4-gp56 family major capsid protein
MSDWSVSGSTPAEVEASQSWALRAMHEGRVRSLVFKFMGESENAVVQTDKQLEKNQGDVINTSLVLDVDTQLGVTGSSGTALEGAEVAPSVYSDSVKLDALRQAIRTDGKLTEQRFAWKIRPEIKDKLAYWVQRRIYDGPFFRKMSGLSIVDKDAATFGEAATTNTNIILGGDKAAVDDLTESDVITFDDLEDAKTCAEAGVLGSTTMVSKIRPGIVDGGEHYVYVGHNYDKHNLQQSDEWNNVLLYAELRGKENPIFTGEIYIWNNVLLFFHDMIVLQNNTGGVSYSTGLFMGAQAGFWIQAQPAPDWVEKTFDYGWKYGIATSMMFGYDKLTYNSLDFGCIALKCASKNPKL